ncbi:IS110 family transposase [Corynebacterium diphtheriae]|nr:IS110 family transposase [Corynebacterium diphtheriae]
MRQLSRIHVGNSKTDVRDAYVITHAYTRLINQMRSALVGTHPAFEHVLHGQMIHRK